MNIFLKKAQESCCGADTELKFEVHVPIFGYYKCFKISFLVFFILSLIVLNLEVSAQNKDETLSVQGYVVDASTQQPLVGVRIEDIQKKTLSVTDVKGFYSLKVKKGTRGFFRFIGYEVLSYQFNDASANLVISMIPSTTEIDEVVVTALGIERQEKTLGYSTTTVKGEDLTDALSNNWTDALSGKVAGLNLVRSNAGPTGSNSIILRGEKDLQGDNEALIVVDGVIINGGSGRASASGSNNYAGADETPVDYGTGLNDINPEDIESVTVLKGPGAAALYGYRGANGAIMITTKSGRPNQKGIGITVNSNTSIEAVNRWPDIQYEYGQGLDGADYYSFGNTVDGTSTRSTSSAWGPKFEGQYFFQYDPVTHTQAKERTPWVPYEGNTRAFFDVGKTFTNTVTLDGGSERTRARFSATNVTNSWIIPNTGYDRNTVALSLNSKPTSKIEVIAKVNYTNKKSDNLPSSGYNNQTIMYWNIFWQPNASLDWLKEYWIPGQENRKASYPYSSQPDNPYLIAYEMLNKGNRHGMTGNVSAKYLFTPDLSVTVRTAMDFSYDHRSQQRPYDTERFKKGMYRTQNIFSQELNSDFMVQYKREISPDFKMSASLGGSSQRNNYIRDELRADSLLYPGVFTLANSAGVLNPLPYRASRAINSFYGLVTAGYRDYLFADFSARQDWSSVLASPTSDANVAIPIYSSLNLSAVISEMFVMPKNINYLKWRGSVAKVGSGSSTPYRTSLTYTPNPLYPGGALSNPTLLPNEGLLPLSTISYETGIDIQFFRNRLGLDVTYYDGKTYDQILETTVDWASGMGKAVVNAGMVQNKGVEIALNGTPIKVNKGLTWSINATFSANKNTVVELTDSLSQLMLQNGPGSRGGVMATIGGSMGDLYGRGYVRSPDGQVVYENGYPLISNDLMYIGNTTPRWKASLMNQFKYKQFAMNFLFDAQFGAVAYSLTQAVMTEQGKTKNTLPGRYNGLIGKGVMLAPDGSYIPNTVIAEDIWTYHNAHSGRDNIEGSTYSTDFIKFREAKIDYTLTAAQAKRLGLQRAKIGVYGRNLLIFSDWPAFDPEFGALSGTEILKGYEIAQFPSTRTFGINLTVGF